MRGGLLIREGSEGRGTASKGNGREERGWKGRGREFPSKVKVSRINTVFDRLKFIAVSIDLCIQHRACVCRWVVRQSASVCSTTIGGRRRRPTSTGD